MLYCGAEGDSAAENFATTMLLERLCKSGADISVIVLCLE